MKAEILSNLPPIGESLAKLASDGGQLFADKIGLFGFFAFCLLFVGACLVVPVLLYEKYYHVADDEPIVDTPIPNLNATDPAA